MQYFGRNEDVPIDLLSGSYIAPINGEAGGLMGSAGANIPSESHAMPTWIASGMYGRGVPLEVRKEKNSEQFDLRGS